jgi:hypothetical protein
MINQKRFFSILFLLLIMALSVNAQTDKLLYKHLQRSNDKDQYYHVPIGLCEDYPEETTTMKIIKSDFEMLKRSGIKLLRISFGWDGIETSKGNFNWLFWDDFVKMAVDDYGITLVPYICYTHKWNSDYGTDSTNYWHYPPQDYDEFGRFVEVLVNRFKDRIKSWELWNEWDIPIYWNGKIEDIAKLVKIGSRAVRKADPNAIVVLGGLAIHPDFLRNMFRDQGISPFVDVVNIHNYYETWSGLPIERISDYVGEVSDIVQRYGNNQSIWMAEVGYSTWRMTKSKVSDDYTAYYKYEHTPQYQAVELFKTLSLVVNTGKISAIAWYEVKDLPPGEEVIGDNNNRNLGVAYSDYKPKPALKALSFFNNLFSEEYKSIDDQVNVDKSLGSKSEVCTFQNEDGSVIVVGWLKTNNFGERKDTTGIVEDNRKETIQLTIPFNLRGKVLMYDELGNEKDYKDIERKNNSVVFKNLTLTGGSISIFKIWK